jgi:cyclophilin family peptidyl-prolyl cis-trans isomerase/protein-disulfide isomerase
MGNYLQIKIYLWVIFTGVLVACGGISKNIPELMIETPTKMVAERSTSEGSDCRSFNLSPTPGPDDTSLFPGVNQNDHIRGGASAGVTIIEYGDFQCPGCIALAPVLFQLTQSYPVDLRVVFRHLPLYDIHDKALIAAQVAEAAGDEGKFWELHDYLFENYGLWITLPAGDFLPWVAQQGSVLGLNGVSFQNKVIDPEIIVRVEQDFEDALRIGLRSTPFLLINGQIYSGPRDYNSLEQVIKLIILGDRQFTYCPEMSINPLKQYIATLQTEKGDIVIQLFADKTPLAVNSFVFLARNGWFDNITFYKVIEGHYAQTGDPSGTGLGGPGYIFDNEPDESLNFDQPGVVAMANTGMNTNGSQFFITTSAQSELNGRYTIFGKVISGMEVLSQLTPSDNGVNSVPQTGSLLIKVVVIEK